MNAILRQSLHNTQIEKIHASHVETENQNRKSMRRRGRDIWWLSRFFINGRGGRRSVGWEVELARRLGW